MSDEHADKRARGVGLTPEQRRQRDSQTGRHAHAQAELRPPVTGKPLVTLDDPAMFEGEVMRAALVGRDVTLVYRLLREVGVTQREIARCTGQSQSEVSDIFRGRMVRDVKGVGAHR